VSGDPTARLVATQMARLRLEQKQRRLAELEAADFNFAAGARFALRNQHRQDLPPELAAVMERARP
jgi:uncharacterized protein involved in type VI secretion and phage assembly